jgi:hypothetical protein
MEELRMEKELTKEEELLNERGYLLQKINQYAGRGDFIEMRKYLKEFERNAIERGKLKN